MTTDEAKYLEAAVVILGGGERQRRNARYLYAHRHEPSDIYVGREHYATRPVAR